MEPRIWTVKFSDGAATTLLLAPDGTWVEFGYAPNGSVLYVTIQSQEWVEHFIVFARRLGATVEGIE